MAAGDVKKVFAASSNLTVTNLHSLASSATWTGGWESAVIDNSSNLYQDYFLSEKITVAAASLSAGQIRVYVFGLLDDSTYPDVFDGTESTETIDAEVRDGFCKLVSVIATDTTNDEVYFFGPVAIAQFFGGQIPAKFGVFVTQSTGQNLAAAGNQITIKGVYDNVASA